MTDPVGPYFCAESLQFARARSSEAVTRIIAQLKPGITQAHATAIARAICKQLGAEREWHRPIIRFGPQTVLGFRDPVEGHATLQASDIATIDIGPVFRGHEGDAGDTCVLGCDPALVALRDTARFIWQATAGHWQTTLASGRALYAFADELARARGYTLRADVRGHRIGDAPHSRYARGPLKLLDRTPTDGQGAQAVQR